MKLRLFFFLIGFLSGHTCVAQAMRTDTPAAPRTILVKDSIPKARYGVKAGVALNSISYNAGFKQASSTGFFAGGVAGISKKKIGLRIEGMLSFVTYSLSNDTVWGGGKLNLLYLDVPVLFQYRLAPFLWVQAGPQIGTLLSVTQSPSSQLSPSRLFESNSISGVAGIEVRLPASLNIGARYVAGLSNISGGHLESWRPSSAQFSVGYTF